MRVLLIEPPFERLLNLRRSFFPLGLASIGAYLEKEGHQVSIYDADSGSNTKDMKYWEACKNYHLYIKALDDDTHPIWNEVGRVIEGFNPQIVGISSMTVKVPAALKIAKLCKKISRKTILVLGGIHPTVKPEEVLSDENIDFVIRGEGEITFALLLKELTGKSNGANLPGLSFKEHNRVINNGERKLVEDLDALPFPARHLLLNLKGYYLEDLGLIMGSRGCPYQCTYCASSAMWKRKVRYRSAENILEEIKYVMSTFGSNQFTFEDDSFTVNKNLVLEFCERLQCSNLRVTWSAITRINLLTPELVSVMKKAGCNHLRVGIESGSEKILRDTQKGLTLTEIREGAKLLKRQKMYWSAYFMVGLPSETEEDIMSTLDLLDEIQPDYATISIFTPYPGTKIYDELFENGSLSPDVFQFSNFSHSSPYNYFSKNIEKEKFDQLISGALEHFDQYNSSLTRLLKRACAKFPLYIAQPPELWQDFRRYLAWRS